MAFVALGTQACPIAGPVRGSGVRTRQHRRHTEVAGAGVTLSVTLFAYGLFVRSSEEP